MGHFGGKGLGARLNPLWKRLQALCNAARYFLDYQAVRFDYGERRIARVDDDARPLVDGGRETGSIRGGLARRVNA